MSYINHWLTNLLEILIFCWLTNQLLWRHSPALLCFIGWKRVLSAIVLIDHIKAQNGLKQDWLIQYFNTSSVLRYEPSVEQHSTVVWEAWLNREHCEQRSRVFSCRLHSLLMLTWGQGASWQEKGNLRWANAALASATQICKGWWECFSVWHLFCACHVSAVALWSGETLFWSDFVCGGVLHLSLREMLYQQRDSF